MSKLQAGPLYTPSVVFQPEIRDRWKQGVNTLVGAIRPTLGPLPRMVAFDNAQPNAMPELLDNGALIARRIYGLSHRTEDTGAMHLRQVLWRLGETIGDGTATAAVIFGKIYNEGLRYIAAGGDPQRLRHHLEKALQVALTLLEDQIIEADTEEKLQSLAMSVCHDRELAQHLSQIFSDVGPFGHLEIRSGLSRETAHEYVQGVYWECGLCSDEFITDKFRFETTLRQPSILVTDFHLDDPQQIAPLIKMIAKAGRKSLVIIASEVSDRVLALLHQLNRDTSQFHVIAVKAPGKPDSWERRHALEDIGILTGAYVFLSAAHETLDRAELSDIGGAEEVWADRTYFGVAGGNGEQAQSHLDELVDAFYHSDDAANRKGLAQRIGRFLGASATLWLSSRTTHEAEHRKALAIRTADTVRNALFDGVVVGGGVALLNCRSKICELSRIATSPEERAAYSILAEALLEPFIVLVENAGYSPSKYLARMNANKKDMGVDLYSGGVVNMKAAGILDSYQVVCSALMAAVKGAAQALTIEVVVHHRKPERVIDP